MLSNVIGIESAMSYIAVDFFNHLITRQNNYTTLLQISHEVDGMYSHDISINSINSKIDHQSPLMLLIFI